MKCTYKKKLVFLVDRPIPAFKFSLLRISLEEKLPEEAVMGLSDVPFILLQPLSFPPSGEGRSILKVKGHKLMSNEAPYFQDVPRCSKSHVNRGEKTEGSSKVHIVEKWHWDGLPET